jgi:hypothetical protein
MIFKVLKFENMFTDLTWNFKYLGDSTIKYYINSKLI